jgi:hypothetical protein
MLAKFVCAITDGGVLLPDLIDYPIEKCGWF